MLLVLINVSENVDRLKKCIERSEVVLNIKSCS